MSEDCEPPRDCHVAEFFSLTLLLALNYLFFYWILLIVAEIFGGIILMASPCYFEFKQSLFTFVCKLSVPLRFSRCFRQCGQVIRHTPPLLFMDQPCIVSELYHWFPAWELIALTAQIVSLFVLHTSFYSFLISYICLEIIFLLYKQRRDGFFILLKKGWLNSIWLLCFIH